MSKERQSTPQEVALAEALTQVAKGATLGIAQIVDDPVRTQELLRDLTRFNELRQEVLGRAAKLAVYIGAPAAIAEEAKEAPEPGPRTFELVDAEHRLIRVGERTLHFGPGEFPTLAYFIRNPGKIIPFAVISKDLSSENIRGIIYRIRQKIEPDPQKPIYLEAILKGPERGYRLNVAQREAPKPEPPEPKLEPIREEPTPEIRKEGPEIIFQGRTGRAAVGGKATVFSESEAATFEVFADKPFTPIPPEELLDELRDKLPNEFSEKDREKAKNRVYQLQRKLRKDVRLVREREGWVLYASVREPKPQLRFVLDSDTRILQINGEQAKLGKAMIPVLLALAQANKPQTLAEIAKSHSTPSAVKSAIGYFRRNFPELRNLLKTVDRQKGIYLLEYPESEREQLLTPDEQHVLAVLKQHPGKITSRAEIAQKTELTVHQVIYLVPKMQQILEGNPGSPEFLQIKRGRGIVWTQRKIQELEPNSNEITFSRPERVKLAQRLLESEELVTHYGEKIPDGARRYFEAFEAKGKSLRSPEAVLAGLERKFLALSRNPRKEIKRFKDAGVRTTLRVLSKAKAEERERIIRLLLHHRLHPTLVEDPRGAPLERA